MKMKTDLEFAFANVPWVTSKGDVNRGAVGHLLTKVNLALGLFDDAIASSTAVINNGTFKLMTSRFGADAANSKKNVIWDLHRPVNKFLASNTEVLFSVIDRFGDPSATTTGTTSMRQALPFFFQRSDSYSRWKTGYDKYIGGNRSYEKLWSWYRKMPCYTICHQVYLG